MRAGAIQEYFNFFLDHKGQVVGFGWWYMNGVMFILLLRSVRGFFHIQLVLAKDRESRLAP
jgi:hypothetical protein